MSGPSHLQDPPNAILAEYGGSQAKTLTLKQTTDDQPDEIIPDVDSTLIPSIPDGTGCGGAVWNDNPEATDFPDVRAWNAVAKSQTNNSIVITLDETDHSHGLNT